MRESKLQKLCQKICRQKGILSVKVDSTSSRGWPDLTLVLPNGVVLFVELKTETGKTSKLQDRMIEKINRNNGNAEVIRNIEQFEQLIESHLIN
jgi:hypothetical protein